MFNLSQCAKSFKIKDIAIIDELDVEFCPGLNIITGETGAGKSIIINAVKLLSGEKASEEHIRYGKDRLKICLMQG